MRHGGGYGGVNESKKRKMVSDVSNAGAGVTHGQHLNINSRASAQRSETTARVFQLSSV